MRRDYRITVHNWALDAETLDALMTMNTSGEQAVIALSSY
jgi:hypothetical protein